MFHSLAACTLDLFFPRFCVCCGMLGNYLCLYCQKKLIVLEKDYCLYCKKSSLYGLTHPSCIRPYGLDGCISIFHYNNQLQRLIHSIKYRLVTDIYPELFTIFPLSFIYKLLFFTRQPYQWYLHPIPLHKNRLRERGFNQSERFMTCLLPFFTQYREDVLFVRSKNTVSQAQLQEEKQKRENVKGAFSTVDISGILGAKVILFDDVTTTGTTLHEACSVLKKSGAKEVFAVTLARG